MSIRILPPPVRTQPFFDGDFRLQTAIALDEEGSTPPLAFVLRLVAQPVGADEEIAQAINLGGDDAQIFTSSAYGLSAALLFAADEDLPQFIRVDEDGQLVLRTIAGAAVLQPLNEDGSGPIVAITVLDDEAQFVFRVWSAVQIAQPLSDDEVGAGLKNFALDEDTGTSFVAVSAVVAQPYGDEGAAPQFVVAVIDEDGQLTIRVYSAPLTAQPFADDEVGASLKNFGLDEDIQPPLSVWAAQTYLQPRTDDDLPQITVTVVDEDGSIILFATNRGPYQLPVWADNELAIAAIRVDEDGYAPIIAPLVAAYAFRQSADDELSISVAAVIEEDGSVAIAARWSAPFAQPLTEDETSGVFAKFVLDEDGQGSSVPGWPIAVSLAAYDEGSFIAIIAPPPDPPTPPPPDPPPTPPPDLPTTTVPLRGSDYGMAREIQEDRPPDFEQDPDTTLDYPFGWAPDLEGDTIATSLFLLPDGMTQVSASQTDTTTVVFLSNPICGRIHRCTNRITTVGGRSFDKTIRILGRQQ